MLDTILMIMCFVVILMVFITMTVEIKRAYAAIAYYREQTIVFRDMLKDIMKEQGKEVKENA